jgi:hypothetical protein
MSAHEPSFNQAGRLRFAAVVATAVTALVLTVILVPGDLLGPGAPGASASVPQTASAAEPTPAASAHPGQTTEPTATPEPMPAWTGLDWVRGTIVGNEDRATGFATINDVVRWNGRYVGAGAIDFFTVEHMFEARAAAFFASDDGVAWTLVQQSDAVTTDYEGSEALSAAFHLEVVADGLVAVSGDYPLASPPQAWRSTDALSWTPAAGNFVDLWTGPMLVDLAAGPAGAVAIGFDGGGCCLTPAGPPVIAYSADGVRWERLEIPTVPERAFLEDVAATPDGFVIVGSVRHPDEPLPASDDSTGDADAHTPAVWTSIDGVHWVAATVEGSEARDARITDVAVGADGLYAIGKQMDTPIGTMEPDRAWVSADGRTWNKAGTPGVDLPAVRLIASDGTRMVIFGPPSQATTSLAGWVSTDGLSWMPLAFSGETQNLPLATTHVIRPDGTEDWVVGTSTISHAWVEPDGVIIGQVMPAPGGGQAIWFGTAVLGPSS